ncbi:MAG TPA: hypothetical protein VGC41_22015, partial [Kofleriaceae bacterium]
MKILLLVMTLFVGVLAPTIASAQPAGVPTRIVEKNDASNKVVRTLPSVVHPHSDIVESNGKGMALLFWVFAVVCIVGALF